MSNLKHKEHSSNEKRAATQHIALHLCAFLAAFDAHESLGARPFRQERQRETCWAQVSAATFAAQKQAKRRCVKITKENDQFENSRFNLRREKSKLSRPPCAGSMSAGCCAGAAAAAVEEAALYVSWCWAPANHRISIIFFQHSMQLGCLTCSKGCKAGA
jgi:hypothetical protein